MSVTDDEIYIGIAWMEEDGTITMQLRADGAGVVGVGTLSYPKHHPQYQMVLAHLGELAPGQQVSVRPWPD
jgi:hypothetical protein